MIYGNFIISGFQNNECFDPNARDNVCAPQIGLRDALKKHGIEINTQDLNKNKKVVFEIHIDNHISNVSNIPVFLFLWETANVHPRNASVDKNKFKKIYTWNDKLVSKEKYNKFHLPVTKNIISHFPRFHERANFCCAMSGNKALKLKHEKDLYIERINLYQWFEKNAPQDFDLYGPGWERPLKKGILKYEIPNKILEKLNIRTNNLSKIYKGYADSKSSVLHNCKFSICYENLYGLEGYVTEKIFDSMFSGCVPIYWGASNIAAYIPEECFIDRRNFADEKSLYKFLKSINESSYLEYQEAISDFFKTEKFNNFSVENFVETISFDIVKELNDNC